MKLRSPAFFRSLSNRQASIRRFWWLCAALLFLSVGSLAQDLLHTFFLRGRISVPYDFSAYYLAGKLAREGQLLYYFPQNAPAKSFLQLRFDDTTPYGRAPDPKGIANPPLLLPFVTPPFAALLMEPFSSVTWQVAYSVWRVAIALASFIAVFFSIRIAAVEKRYHFVSFAVAVGVFCAFFPFKAQIALGQIDCVILLTWTLGTWLFLKHRPVGSSLCYALGTAIKVSPILVVPLMLMRRQWRWLAYYMLWSLAILGLSIWSVGWQNHVLWLTKVSPLLSCGAEHFDNRSLPGFVMGICNTRGLLGLVVPPGICAFNKGLCALSYLGFLGWCWTKRKGAGGLTHELVLTAVVCLLVSPVSWPGHYLLATLPLTYLWVKTLKGRIAASKFEIGLLSAVTLLLGIGVPEYFGRELGTTLMLAVMGAWVAATMGVIWLGMPMYDRCVPSVQPIGSSFGGTQSPQPGLVHGMLGWHT
jgi:hypothetical protein